MREGKDDFPEAVTSVNQFPDDGYIQNAAAAAQNVYRHSPSVDLGSQEAQGSFENT